MKDENTRAIARFANRLDSDELKASTIRCYTKVLSDFFEHVVPTKHYRDITVEDIYQYDEWKKKQNELRKAQIGKDEHGNQIMAGRGHGRATDRISPRTKNLAYAAFRSFYKSLNMYKLAKQIKFKKARSWRPISVSKDQNEQIYNRALSPETAKDVYSSTMHKNPSLIARDHLIVELAYSTGLRVSEIANAKVGDLDLRESPPRIHVPEGKSIARVITLSHRWVKEWLAYYAQTKGDLKDAGASLFLTDSGKPLRQSTINLRCRLILAQAKIKNITSIHKLRHAYCHGLLPDNSLPIIQALMGHSSLAVTSTYLKAAGEDVGKVISPLDRMDEVLEKKRDGNGQDK